jgi:glycosyltransferase involved in cell wall biosynthesis
MNTRMGDKQGETQHQIDWKPAVEKVACPDFSLIIPLFNEADNVANLVAKVQAFLKTWPLASEVLLINDGSRDATKERINQAIQGLPNFRAFHFRINLGKSAAYTLGFRKARGRLVATMDGDLQDDPMDFHTLLEKLNEGNDLVIGWKHQGKSGAHKAWLSKAFNKLIRLCTGMPWHDVNCPMRIMRRECIKSTHLTGDSFRFLPVLLAWRGFKVGEAKVSNLPRLNGASKYGLRRYGQAFFDLFTLLFLHRYRQKPMHFFGIFGFGLFGIGFCIDAFLTLRGLLITGVIGHFNLMMLGLFLMLFGLQILLFGFMAALIDEKRKDELLAYVE